MEKKRGRESLLMLSLVFMLSIIPAMSFAGESLQQDKKLITVSLQNAPIKTLLDDLHRQTGISFVYNNEQIKGITVSVVATNKPFEYVLKDALLQTRLTYTIKDNIVTLQTVKKERLITGIITDEEGEALPGALIYNNQLNISVTTDMDGYYRLEVPENRTMNFVVSFVGMTSQTLPVKAGTGNLHKDFKMKGSTTISEVVVNGIYTRKAESFTGAATTITNKELLRAGNSNVFQSLKNIDPTLYISDNMNMGSDPNTVPNMSMRGTSSFPTGETSSLRSNYQNQPNQPLFILDGFETSAETIMDMDMNRIESITILKDASAKALYGSKAANGVIVIETKRLSGNKQLVMYNGSISIEMPDLSSYNMCNAAEKLEAERLDGVYTSNSLSSQITLDQLYNSRKQTILNGLDTYWLSKPLHTGIGHKHNISIELGDANSLRSVLDFTYNKVSGVMKGSDRQNISGNANFSYRKNNLLFKNIFTIVSNSSNDSPYGSFSDYVTMNPYWQATDENNNVLRYAEYTSRTDNIPNPMYNATIGTSFTSDYLQFTNNFYTEWKFLPDWKATARIGVSQKRNNSDSFYPAQHSMFSTYGTEDTTRRGKYIMETGKQSSLSGDLNLNYNKSFGKHSLFGNAGFFISETKYSAYQHTAEGFSNTQNADITFAKQYAAGVTPIGSSSINREASFLLALSYDYDNRYLADATIRESASSLYGKDNRWANSWSFGLGWNMHNEAFMKDISWIKQLKIRGSVGLTGNQNFNTNAAIATYQYFSGKTYGGIYNPMTGAYITNLPNNELKWEQKKDYNIGFDMRIAGVSLSADYYSADTKNMLTDVTIPTSTGFSSVKDNLGLVRNSGIEFKANYSLWQNKDGFVNLFGTFVYNKNKIIKLSDSMRSYNEKMKKLAEQNNTSAPVLMYEDGLSMNTIWAVPSAGIDPQSGKEMYIKKDGSYTYTYSSNDMIAAGNADPKYRGNVGFMAEYKGIGLSATLSYLAGGQMYNSTLVDRVENADITYNVDRRLLLGRWTTPGQITQYKGFQSDEVTRATTRFVQDRNELTISAISAYYEFPESIYKKLRMQRLRFAFNMNDIATFSSIRVERGTSYPFARTMTFSLTGTF